MPAKSIFKSKVFWSNVLLATVAVSSGQFGILIPAEAAVPIVAGANIALRFITKGPASLFRDE